MLKKLAEIFRRGNWEERFLVGKKKAQKLLSKLKKAGKSELTTEAIECLDYYGVPVADYRVVASKREIYSATQEMGLPVVVKSVTSKAVHREDAGAVYVVERKEQIEEAYPQVLGEIATRMPWVSITGIMVQEYVPGEDKCWIKLERDRKESKFKAWIKRILKGKEEEKEAVIEKKEDLGQFDMEEDFAGVFAFAMHFKEIRKLESDFVHNGENWILVDSKVWLFD